MPIFAPKQNKSAPKVKSFGPSAVHEALRSSSKPLDRVTREHVESRFGHDFSRVRVHTDPRAGDAAAGIHARAFTVSHDIVFGAGEYAPHTGSGLRLLAHELTHVVQQRVGVHLRDGLGQASDEYEQHADAVAALIVQGKPAASLLRSAVGSGQAVLRSPGALQKQEDPGKGKPPTTSSGPGLIPVTFKELDVNPARGAMQQAQMLAQRHAAGKKPHSADEGWPALFKALRDALERVDKSLTSDAPQSWGLHLWGEGTSSAGSTAAKPAKDVAYLSSTGIDLTEVLEIMDILVLSVSTKKEMFKTPEDFMENPVEYVFDLKQKIDAIEKARDEDEKRRRAKESRERSAQGEPLLQESQELKKLVKVALDKIKVPSIEKKATTAGTPVGQAPREAKTTSPKTAKPASYDRDPMSYWNSYPLAALFEGISGDPYSTGGAVAIITDKQGTKRVFRYWLDEDGYQRSEFLKKVPTP